MIEAGVFQPDDRLQLINGEIVEMSPQGSRHATAVRLVERALSKVFGAGHDIRSQLPLSLGDHSEPEPDVAVVRGAPRDYTDAHPSRALLVVEVSDSTLRLDRAEKLRVYAANGIPEYWIVNLIETTLEVYRDPASETYRSKTTYTASDTVAPVAQPETVVSVADLLP